MKLKGTLSRMSKIRVVVADDSAVFRKSLLLMLQSLPHVMVVGVAEDGEAALRCVNDLDPDLLLLDLQMPKVDGWEVLQWLKRQSARVRIFVLSGHPASFAPVAEERGAAAYLAKDNPQAIVNAIAALTTVQSITHSQLS